MFCPKCGGSNPDKAMFCDFCGESLHADEAPPTDVQSGPQSATSPVQEPEKQSIRQRTSSFLKSVKLRAVPFLKSVRLKFINSVWNPLKQWIQNMRNKPRQQNVQQIPQQNVQQPVPQQNVQQIPRQPVGLPKPEGWVDRNVDDLFFAANEGDADKVREILTYQPELLSNRIVSAMEEGGEISFTVFFSILVKMNEQGMNYNVLKALDQFGVDFNQIISLNPSDHTHSFRPLLFYPVAVWKNYNMARYLLEHGANPNAIVVDNTENRYYLDSNITMLFYAIRNNQGTDMMNLLLSYGADPRMFCEPLAPSNPAVRQHVLPMYYTVVDQVSPEKTACLMQYGASPQDIIDVGVGFMHRNSFDRYIRMLYPEKHGVIDIALNMLRGLPTPRVRYVYLNMYGQINQNSVTTAGMNPTMVTNRVNPNVTKKCYNKFTAYLFANFSFLALGFCVIGPLLRPEIAIGLLTYGLPCLLIAALIGFLVYSKGKKYGQTYFFGEFILDSLLIFIKVLLISTIILIPVALMIGGASGDWQERKLVDGRSVIVRETSRGHFEDPYGNKYR